MAAFFTNDATNFRLEYWEPTTWTCIRPYWIDNVPDRDLTDEQIVEHLKGTFWESFTSVVLDVIHRMEAFLAAKGTACTQ